MVILYSPNVNLCTTVRKLWDQGKKTGSTNGPDRAPVLKGFDLCGLRKLKPPKWAGDQNPKKALRSKKTKELLILTKQRDNEIYRLKIALMEKSAEVEKLKELCLKRREEIKSMKSAITSFPC